MGDSPADILKRRNEAEQKRLREISEDEGRSTMEYLCGEFKGTLEAFAAHLVENDFEGCKVVRWNGNDYAGWKCFWVHNHPDGNVTYGICAYLLFSDAQHYFLVQGDDTVPDWVPVNLDESVSGLSGRYIDLDNISELLHDSRWAYGLHNEVASTTDMMKEELMIPKGLSTIERVSQQRKLMAELKDGREQAFEVIREEVRKRH